MYAGRVAAAVDDFAALTRIQPTNPYALLWLHIVRRRAGQDDKQELEANAARVDQRRWPWPIVAFYLGNEGADAVFAAATTTSTGNPQTRLCDADFFIATDRLVSRDQREARGLLEAAVKDCSVGDRDRYHAFAAMELARLDALATSHANP
jgi:lipoprotein NlpI